MIRFHKFRQDLFGLVSAKEVYIARPSGKGWPEECPPIRAANAFGYDILANFDLTFVRKGAGWAVKDDRVLESDFAYTRTDDAEGVPLTQQYAWFWEKGQKIPHVITDNVFKEIRNQVKVSSFLFLQTDPNELLMMTEVPNQERPWRAMTAVVDTDWYPASYPWHVVLELDPGQKSIRIRKGEPICRVIPLRRDTYFAQPMTPDEFSHFFDRGQQWLATHGKPVPDAEPGTVDLKHTYVRQQLRSRFVVME